MMGIEFITTVMPPFYKHLDMFKHLNYLQLAFNLSKEDKNSSLRTEFKNWVKHNPIAKPGGPDLLIDACDQIIAALGEDVASMAADEHWSERTTEYLGGLFF